MYGYTFRRIVTVALLIFALVSALVGAALWKMHATAIEEAGQGVSSLAGMLAEQAQQSVQALDLAINEVEGALALDDTKQLADVATSRDVQRALATIAAKHASIDMIAIDDANGATLAASRGLASQASSPVDPIFDFLKNNRSRETQAGAFRVSEATGAMVVDLFRRIERPDGAFLGVIRMSVTPASLVTTYSPISSMPGRSYALFTREGATLVRYPDANLPAGARMAKSSPWHDIVARGGGVYIAVSPFDGQDRIIAARPVPFSQFVVTVSILRSTVLAQWREQALTVVIAALLALLIAAFLVEALFVQFNKLAEKEAALRANSSALALSNERFSSALGNMSQGLAVFDARGRLIISNERYATLYGLEASDIQPGMKAADVLAIRAARGKYAGASPAAYVQQALARTRNDQRIDHLNDGRAILVNHALCADGGIVVTHEDVTEREQTNTRIAHMAMHDELTQLANRALFRHTLDCLRATIGSAHVAVVVMLIDLDDFKPVNDTYGHVAGDALLRECAQRILRVAPYAHVVARLGGDEFAIAYGVTTLDPEAAEREAQRLIDAISATCEVHGQSLEIGACVGVAIHDDAALTIDDMMRRADLALYAAKGQGARRRRMFEPYMELEALTRRELAADLSQAIANNSLYLAYQPVVNAATLEIQQMEALLRWRHPRRGEIPPQEFIGLAEETHLIDALGAWVFERVCADVAHWPEHIGVAVNVSPLQLSGVDFVGSVLRTLDRAGVDPSRMELEITESVLLNDKGDSLAALHRLRDRGIAIALDDFGTGFSSMSYLKRFPFDRLKIDRSFVADIARDAGSTAIIAATIHLAQAYEIGITAEGVETDEQYRALRALGVGQMQGYLFGRPKPLVDGMPTIEARRVA